ncbi:MAG: putative DNA binding domain-containing protein [Planctomycetes bacterium]|nr:putative DNA binding domain-containing protein [Planctomycetota bacterium]
MMRYSDAELERLLGDLEPERVERKASWSGDAPDRCRQAICAFANDLPDHRLPGVLFIGVNDEGSPVALGLVQRFGMGIAIARAELQKNGNPPPELRPEPSTVLAVVRKKP